LNFILRCMPNLRQFIITIICSSSFSSFCGNMFKGDQWQRLLTNGPSQLDAFDIFLFIKHSDLILDIDIVIKSFDYFASIYNDWYMAIHQFQHTRNNRSKTKELANLFIGIIII